MSLSKFASLETPTVGESPNQPKNITFPKLSFGKTRIVQRAFNPSWFDKWSWLHWDQASERAFCHTCVSAYQQKKLRSSTADAAFISRGFHNWKDATVGFRNPESSSCHKEALQSLVTLPSTNRDVAVCLSSSVAEERRVNRECFLKILSTIHFLARQGLPLRGDGRGELDGNFTQLLQLRARDDSTGHFADWLQRKSSRYTSHDIQNEILELMALRLLRQIAEDLRSTKFTIMVDETTDISTKEQVVIVFRWVDDQLEVHEEFVGLYATDSIAADPLVAIVKDVLLRLNLKLENCRGQCYDGASNMKGCRTGVATQIQAAEARAIYTHCYGHALNLACQDTIRDVKVVKDALDTMFEISKLLKYSSKRNAAFLKIRLLHLILASVRYVLQDGLYEEMR